MNPIKHIIELLNKYENTKLGCKKIVTNPNTSEEDASAAMLMFLTYQNFQTDLKNLKIMLENKCK